MIMLVQAYRSKFIFLCAAWFFISAFYYLNNFYSGNLVVSNEDGLLHRLLKYFVVLCICVYFVLVNRIVGSLLFYISLFLLVVFFLILGSLNYSVEVQLALLLIVISFSGLTLVSYSMSDRELNYILDAVVFSSIFVSFISFYEYFYMWPVLGDYWQATGGYRSVSTMLNPNNLGVYLGASLLLILIRDRFTFLFRLVSFLIIVTAILMSGSRTAIISLALPVFLGLLFFEGFKVRVGFLVFSIGLFLFSLVVFNFSELSLEGRLANMQTAYIRLNKYFDFIYMLDFSYLYPDFDSVRAYYVSESSYFYVVNTLGLFCVSYLFFLYIVFYKISFASFCVSGPKRALVFVLFYYLISFLFENMFASFPNNQFFFFALGALLAPRRVY